MEKWRYCDVERNERRRLYILQRKCKIYGRVKNFFFWFFNAHYIGFGDWCIRRGRHTADDRPLAPGDDY